MALTGVGLGTPRFFRAATLPDAPTKSLAQQSQDLSNAMAALQAPAILPASPRTGVDTQMATLCLVQPDDTALGDGSLGNALAAYATVFTD